MMGRWLEPSSSRLVVPAARFRAGSFLQEFTMGVSYRPLDQAIPVRTGAERATLVRRTYTLVFASILVTMVGVWFGLSQPQLMAAVARHPFITLLCTFAPLILALKLRDAFPANLGLVFLFTLVEGVA